MGYIMSSYPTEVELSQFRKDKFLIDKGTSYDELYILNVKGLEIDEVDHFDSVAALQTVLRQHRGCWKPSGFHPAQA